MNKTNKIAILEAENVLLCLLLKNAIPYIRDSKRDTAFVSNLLLEIKKELKGKGETYDVWERIQKDAVKEVEKRINGILRDVLSAFLKKQDKP